MKSSGALSKSMVVTLVSITSAATILCNAFGCRPGGENTVPNKDIKSVMEAHAPELMSIPGVTAVAIGELEDGTPCIKVYVVEKSEELSKKIPARLEGHPVVIEESGEFEPMDTD